MMLALFIGWLFKQCTKGFSLPVLIIFAFIILNALSPLRGDFQELVSPFKALHYGFAWLKQDADLKETEINTGKLQPTGVMAPWDIGHHLHFYAEMPTVSDNFGIFYLDKTPGESLKDMARFF